MKIQLSSLSKEYSDNISFQRVMAPGCE